MRAIPNRPTAFFKVQEAIQQASAASSVPGTVDRAGFLRRIDGLVFDDNPDQGVLRGSRFLHAGLRFSLDFPSGWDVSNSASQVVAKQPDTDAFIVLRPVLQPTGRDIELMALNSMQNAGFQARDGSRTRLNGLDAFVGTCEGEIEDVGQVVVRAAHVMHQREVFMIAGLAPAGIFGQVERDLTSSVRSFRPLTAAQAEDIRPNRVDLYVAREGDSWESIAERQGKGFVKPTTLAIMNNHGVNDPPRPGERLKIVVAG